MIIIMTLDNIKEEINKANSIVLLTHENPDGDAIGSALAMYNSLKQLNKNVDVIIPEIPNEYKFLAGIEDVKAESNITTYDLAISVDCGDIKRLNGFANYFENAKVKINIDHHETNTMFADYNFVNPDAPACAQILITVLEYIGIEIDKNIGTCLLTGIITDTGGFRYQGTNSATFEFTAWLLGLGVNVSEIYRRVLQLKTRTSFELRKIATDRLEFLENGKITFTYITLEDGKNIGAQSSDTNGIVEMGRDIEGVEVSIFLKEKEAGVYKVSLRSASYVNVSDVCLMFNGGGHPRAAGAIISAPLEEAKEKLVSEIRRHL